VIWLRCGNQPTPVVEQLIQDHARAIATLMDDDEAACLEMY